MISINNFVKFNTAAYKQKFSNDESWQKLTDSNELGLSKHGYYGIAFINKQDKKIVIANSGTNFNFLDLADLYGDLKSNYQISQHQLPDQYLNGAKPFMQSILNNSDFTNNYHISITGHSMGATLSELQLIEFSNKMRMDAHLFESFGNLDLLQKYYSAVQISDLDINIYNFNDWQNCYGKINNYLIKVNEELAFNRLLNILPKYQLVDQVKNHWFKNIADTINNSKLVLDIDLISTMSDNDYCPINISYNPLLESNICLIGDNSSS